MDMTNLRLIQSTPSGRILPVAAKVLKQDTLSQPGAFEDFIKVCSLFNCLISLIYLREVNLSFWELYEIDRFQMKIISFIYLYLLILFLGSHYFEIYS